MPESLEFEYKPSKDVFESLLEERILADIPGLKYAGEDMYLHWGVELFRRGFYVEEIALMLSDLWHAAQY